MKFWNEDLDNELKYKTDIYAKTTSTDIPEPFIYNEGNVAYYQPNQPPDTFKINSIDLLKQKIDSKYSKDYQNSIFPMTTQSSPHNQDVSVGSSTNIAFYLFGIIIFVFVFINFIFLSVFLWRKWKKIQLKLDENYDNTNHDKSLDDGEKRIYNGTQKNGNDLYELVKMSNYSGVQSKDYAIDPHAKVVDWMSHDHERTNHQRLHKPDNSPHVNFNDKIYAGKINVGIDATPYGMTESILNQEPIELTKGKLLHEGQQSIDSYENITSFIETDENDGPTNHTLLAIQKRNLPKVLPNFNDNALKRRSLPSQTFLQNNPRIPPAPPPRTTSTLGRIPSTRRNSINVTTSPLKLAEEPPDQSKEPEITFNILHVGPLIPKSDSLYSTISRKRPVSDSNNDNSDKHTASDNLEDKIDTSIGQTQTEPDSKSQQYKSETYIKKFPPDVIQHESNRISPESTISSSSSSNKTASSVSTVKQT